MLDGPFVIIRPQVRQGAVGYKGGAHPFNQDRDKGQPLHLLDLAPELRHTHAPLREIGFAHVAGALLVGEAPAGRDQVQFQLGVISVPRHRVRLHRRDIKAARELRYAPTLQRSKIRRTDVAADDWRVILRQFAGVAAGHDGKHGLQVLAGALGVLIDAEVPRAVDD